MKTRKLIKEKGLELFNQQGVMFVTLRGIAAALEKSYGNITYHFATKEKMVAELYHDMISELQHAASGMMQGTPSLEKVLLAPAATFEVGLRYLFLHKDYVDILRNYPETGKLADQNNRTRKQAYMGMLKVLHQQGILQPGLQEEDLDYLMELSGAMRTFFFMQLDIASTEPSALKKEYIRYVNRLLYPYLSEQGREIYHQQEKVWSM
jgi:AcrR family transcriptional regulator